MTLKDSLLEGDDVVEGPSHLMLCLLDRFSFYLAWLRFFFFF